MVMLSTFLIPEIIIAKFFFDKIQVIWTKKLISELHRKIVPDDKWKDFYLKRYINEKANIKTVANYFYDQGGGKSSDPDDPAAGCVPEKDMIHTVNDVTFCTYKKITGKNYSDFLNMSRDDFEKIIKHFLKQAVKYNKIYPFYYLAFFCLWAGTDKFVLKAIKKATKPIDVYNIFKLQIKHFKNVNNKKPSTKKYFHGWVNSWFVFTNMVLNSF